jgi:hypothetical protein
MAYTTIGRAGRGRGSISGLAEAMAGLKALSKALSPSETKRALAKVQGQGFEKIRRAVYGSQYGVSLATIFSKTRPRTKDNKRSRMGKGLGTPVKTGRLQKSLTVFGDPFGIYSQEVGKSGEMRVQYGGNPLDPKTGKAYFQDVEDSYGFFQEGLAKFEQGRTMQALGDDLAYLFGRAVHDHIKKSVASAKK